MTDEGWRIKLQCLCPRAPSLLGSPGQEQKRHQQHLRSRRRCEKWRQIIRAMDKNCDFCRSHTPSGGGEGGRI